MRQETFFVLDSDEFDQLIKTNFPKQKDFDFISAKDCPNDSDHAYMAAGIDPVDQDEIDDFEKWSNGERVKYFSIDSIIDGMIRKGILEAGSYLIQVSW